jgi:hypothetical protein
VSFRSPKIVFSIVICLFAVVQAENVKEAADKMHPKIRFALERTLPPNHLKVQCLLEALRKDKDADTRIIQTDPVFTTERANSDMQPHVDRASSSKMIEENQVIFAYYFFHLPRLLSSLISSKVTKLMNVTSKARQLIQG